MREIKRDLASSCRVQYQREIFKEITGWGNERIDLWVKCPRVDSVRDEQLVAVVDDLHLVLAVSQKSGPLDISAPPTSTIITLLVAVRIPNDRCSVTKVDGEGDVNRGHSAIIIHQGKLSRHTRAVGDDLEFVAHLSEVVGE